MSETVPKNAIMSAGIPCGWTPDSQRQMDEVNSGSAAKKLAEQLVDALDEIANLKSAHARIVEQLEGKLKHYTECVAINAKQCAEKEQLQSQLQAAQEEIEQIGKARDDYWRQFQSVVAEIESLKEQFTAMQWQPITPENLPKVGDEVLRRFTSGDIAVDTVNNPDEYTFDEWDSLRYTHFRPIGAPE